MVQSDSLLSYAVASQSSEINSNESSVRLLVTLLSIWIKSRPMQYPFTKLSSLRQYSPGEP